MESDRIGHPEEFSIGDADAVLDALIRRSEECVHVLDLDGRVVRWNSACESAYGWKAGSVLGQVLPFAVESRRKRVVGDIRMMAASGAVTEREGTFVRPDSSRVRVRMSVIPVSDMDGHPCGVAVVSRDPISDERLDRQRDEIADYVGQGLSTPLSVISNAAALLARAEVTDDPVRRGRLVGVIQAHVRSASEFVSDLMNVSLLSRGELLLNREPADLRTIASDAVAGLGVGARRVVLDFDADVPLAPLDGPRLERVVQVLTRRALDSAPESTAVHLSVLSGQDHVSLRIRVGGARATKDTHRVDGAPATEREEGLLADDAGVASHLARGLTEAHGGIMRVDFAEPDGHTFELQFPKDGGSVQINGRPNLG